MYIYTHTLSFRGYDVTLDFSPVEMILNSGILEEWNIFSGDGGTQNNERWSLLFL